MTVLRLAIVVVFTFSFVSVRAADTPDAGRFPGVSRVDFFGYANCIALANDTTRVVLCHQAGGRVLEYSRHGKNAIWLDPEQQGWELATGAPGVNPAGGRFDIGPEMTVPRRPALWAGRWTAEATGPRAARLTSAADPATGVQLVRDFVLDAEGSGLSCTQTIRNVSPRATEWCHWSRTLAIGGGIVVIPLTSHSRFPKDYVMYENGLINPRPSDPNIRTRDGFLEIIGPPKFRKLGMDSQAGWFAYLMPNDLLFVKRYPVYPDRPYGEVAALTISIWYDGDVRCELEPIGPTEKLAPGESASFTEEWRLEPFAFPSAGTSVDLQNVAAVSSPRPASARP